MCGGGHRCLAQPASVPGRARPAGRRRRMKLRTARGGPRHRPSVPVRRDHIATGRGAIRPHLRLMQQIDCENNAISWKVETMHLINISHKAFAVAFPVLLSLSRHPSTRADEFPDPLPREAILGASLGPVTLVIGPAF